jgi:acetyl/propionyl-CoA carboxylase alpha subunit
MPQPAAPPFRRVLVANRGEIAVRVMRACRELGITPVAVYSDADADAPHVRAAELAERIGPPSPAESYLSIDAIVDAARRSGAEAVHPGYGFLSENADFARAVTQAGLVFVGPPAEAIEALGNKLAARRSAAAAGVPIVPGTTVALTDDLAALEHLRFPVMLKAAAGGGGRGMRRVDSRDGVADAMAAARREAESAFGDGTIYVEQMVSPARHVEVQLLGDRHGNLAVLGERDCSVQRRHQKLVEESPSPGIDEATRAALFESARRVAGTVRFENAATVEFLVDVDQNHYFLEMNTRLQVEHGVTELVTGLDLVAWQLRIAAGEELPSEVLEAPRRGHAIEVRLYAEDPYDGFRPTHGRIGAWVMPDGPGVRVDAATEADMPLRLEYDPLLAKLMVHAENRDLAVARLRRALDETLIGGLQTDAGFLRWLVDDPGFAGGAYDTSLIPQRWYDRPPPLDADTLALVAFAALSVRKDTGPGERRAEVAADAGSAWGRLARREALR